MKEKGFKSIACLLHVPRFAGYNRTLLELWVYNLNTLTLSRQFSGPVFERVIPYSKMLSLQLLFSRFSDTDFASFSAYIIGQGLVHHRFENTRRFNTIRSSNVYTVIGTTALIVTAVLVVTTLLLEFSVSWKLRLDERPVLNSIDGLSSIMKEEFTELNESNSLVTGNPVKLGMTRRNGQLKFGPVSVEDKVVKADSAIMKEYWKLKSFL